MIQVGLAMHRPLARGGELPRHPLRSAVKTPCNLLRTNNLQARDRLGIRESPLLLPRFPDTFACIAPDPRSVPESLRVLYVIDNRGDYQIPRCPRFPTVPLLQTETVRKDYTVEILILRIEIR